MNRRLFLQRQLAEFFELAGFDKPRRSGLPKDALLRPNPRVIVKCARRNNDIFSTLYRPWKRRPADSAKARGKEFGPGIVESADKLLASKPAELFRRHKQICRMSPTGKFPATRAMTVLEYFERRSYFVSDTATQTTALHREPHLLKQLPQRIPFTQRAMP